MKVSQPILKQNQCFQDKSISTSLPVIDLIDTIAPGAIRDEMVKKEDLSPEDMLNNAKYVNLQALRLLIHKLFI